MALELVKVVKKFSGFTLGPLTLRVENNKTLVIIGPTGSGKSTILNIIAGLLRPDAGSIILDGTDITRIPVHLRATAFTFQNPCLFPHLNAYENIVFGLHKKIRKENEGQIRELLKDLGILHIIHRSTQEMSGGQMQKVSLARMLVTNPRIILMDEPLAHLDQPTRRLLRFELRQILKKRNIPSIYVTHFEDDVYALADYVSILKDGSVRYNDTIESMLKDHNGSRDQFVSAMFSETNYLEGEVIRSDDGITTFSIGSSVIEIIGGYKIGSRVGVLVKPEDIILSRQPIKTSARNMLMTKITEITHGSLGVLDIHLKSDMLHLICRITEQAREDLGLQRGDCVFAMFKASSPQIVREG